MGQRKSVGEKICIRRWKQGVEANLGCEVLSGTVLFVGIGMGVT